MEFDPNTSLVTISQRKIRKALKGIDKENQLQSLIDPEIYFKRNSINVLISRRGVGKTYTVMTELIKLSQLPENGGYTQFIYITDKTNDSTVNELIKLINLKTRVVGYKDAYDVLKDIMEAKTAYEQILTKNLQNETTEESKEDILRTLELNDFVDYIPNTAILMDDAINILKESKHKKLTNLIFQNRQPRFTFFICVQDSFGVPTCIKGNLDTAWIFAGMTDRTTFGMMIRQLGLTTPSAEVWEFYISLGFHDAMVLDYEPGGIKVSVVIKGKKVEVF
jgi:hypothetical protein